MVENLLGIPKSNLLKRSCLLICTIPCIQCCKDLAKRLLLLLPLLFSVVVLSLVPGHILSIISSNIRSNFLLNVSPCEPARAAFKHTSSHCKDSVEDIVGCVLLLQSFCCGDIDHAIHIPA